MTVSLSPDDSGGREFELIETASYQLRSLSAGLLRLGVQLDINEVPAGRWEPVVRTLALLDGLSSRNLVAVAGEQGAGKTHLLANLYPAAAGWLAGNIGRGEKTAVAVQERSACTDPRGIVVRRRRWNQHGRKTDSQPGEGLTYRVAYTFDRREEWRAALMGESSDVLLAVLEVPLGFLGHDGDGFVLLPGFERVRDTEWQLLMKLVLATSRAALVVVDSTGLAGGTQAEILEHLRRAGGEAIGFVVVVSRCEEVRSPDVLAQRVRRAMEVYGARESDVIPVGRTRGDPPDWPARLHAALEPIRLASARSHQLEAALLRQVIRDDVRDVVEVARTAVSSSALRTNDVVAQVDEYMLLFDRACDKLRRDLRAAVHEAFGRHYQMASERLGDSLERSGWKYVRQSATDKLRMEPGETAARLRAAVQEAWDPDLAQQVQRRVIEEVADGMWRTYGQEFTASLTASGRGQAALAVLGGYSRSGVSDDLADDRSRASVTDARPALPGTAAHDRAGIGSSLRVLPGAALQARAFALRLAAPDGQIPAAPGDRVLNEILRDVAGFQRQLVALLSVVAGDADPPEGQGTEAEGQGTEAEGQGTQAEGQGTQAEGQGTQAEGPSEILGSLTQIASDFRLAVPAVKKLLSGKSAAAAASAAGQAGKAVAATGTATAAVVGGTDAVAAAVPALATTAVAGEATGAAATAAGATAGTALTAALTAAGVAALAGIVLLAGNRVVRERDRLAAAWLTEWRTATEAGILMNAEELLRNTREIVYQRLCSALGADEDSDQRFRLLQAIQDVRRDWALMLEVLGDDHLG